MRSPHFRSIFQFIPSSVSFISFRYMFYVFSVLATASKKIICFHIPLSSINFPVGVFLDASISAHIYLMWGFFLGGFGEAFQSI